MTAGGDFSAVGNAEFGGDVEIGGLVTADGSMDVLGAATFGSSAQQEATGRAVRHLKAGSRGRYLSCVRSLVRRV